MIRFNQQGLSSLIILLVVVVLAGGGFAGYKYLNTKNSTSSTTPSAKVTKKVVVSQRSKTPGVVLAALTAHGYNPKTGAAIKPDKYFTTKDTPLYLLMNINKPKIGTRLEYVRYLQGKYLDHKSIKITQPNLKFAYFDWNNKPGKSHKKGVYRVRLYSNGVLEKKINYVISSK